jgi:hypothetical protein
VFVAPNWFLSIGAAATNVDDEEVPLDDGVPTCVRGGGGVLVPEPEPRGEGDMGGEARREDADDAKLEERDHNEVGVTAEFEGMGTNFLGVDGGDDGSTSMSTLMLFSCCSSASSSSSAQGKKLRKRASACHLLAFLNSIQTSIRPGRDRAGSRRSK